MDLEKALLRKVGEAIQRFKMIRDGDRVAVALSGGKDSATLLEALLLLEKRAPIDFSLCAFTVEQGKFLRPIEPLGEYLKQRGVAWTYFRDAPSLKLLEDQPEHGCDLCSRYRRRAVYEIAHDLGANVIAFGHTADDFCEALLRNTMFTGKLSALPPVTHSRDREYRLIRPLVFVTEDIGTANQPVGETPERSRFRTEEAAQIISESAVPFLPTVTYEAPHLVEARGIPCFCDQFDTGERRV